MCDFILIWEKQSIRVMTRLSSRSKLLSEWNLGFESRNRLKLSQENWPQVFSHSICYPTLTAHNLAVQKLTTSLDLTPLWRTRWHCYSMMIHLKYRKRVFFPVQTFLDQTDSAVPKVKSLAFTVHSERNVTYVLVWHWASWIYTGKVVSVCTCVFICDSVCICVKK